MKIMHSLLLLCPLVLMTSLYAGVPASVAPPTCKSAVSFQIISNSCSVNVTASSLLDNGPYNDNDFFIEFFDAPIPNPPISSGQGAAAATPQAQQYRITEIATGESCVGTISVSDAKRPTPICQNGIVANLSPSGSVTVQASDLDVGSYDNCGPVTFGISTDEVNYSPSLTFHCPSISPVYLGVTDPSGNFDYCATFVIVQDNNGYTIPPPPVVVCNDEVQVSLDDNCQALIENLMLLEGGPYGPACWYFLEFFEGPGFTNPVASGYGTALIPSGYAGQTLVYRVTNTDSGNSCSGKVGLEEKTQPDITCPDNQEIPADANCMGVIGSWNPLSVSDNCTPLANLTVTQLTPPGQVLSGHNDIRKVILQVFDGNGNMNSCAFFVTLKDVTPPVIACPADQTRTGCPYTASGTEFDFSFVSENCLGGGFGFDWSLSGATTGSGAGTTLAGAAFQSGITTVQWAMTDGAGNTGYCAFTVTSGGVVITGITVTGESCQNAADGAITIQAVSYGGTLQYSIDGGVTFSASNTFSSLAPGSYNIVVTQLGITGGCDASDVVTVAAGPAPATWYKDLDNDGYSDGVTQRSCPHPPGYKLLQNLIAAPVGNNVDCNDNDPVQFPGQTWYKDQDNDGYSDGATKIQCAQPGGYKAAVNLIATSGDCQDGNGNVPGMPKAPYASIYPTAPEVCNGIDDDCDGSTDEGISGFNFTGNVSLNSQAAVNTWPPCYAKITGNLTISGSGITSLAPLANLTEVTGNVTITGNAVSDLTGLDGLTTIGGNLSIRQNNQGARLSSMQGLQNVVSVGGNLQIRQNNNLTDCCPIELLILNGGVAGSINISQNQTGCDNVNQVLNGCPGFTVGGEDRSNPAKPSSGFIRIDAPPSMTLYPNPAVQEANIRLSAPLAANGVLRVYNAIGTLVWQQDIAVGR